jgi:hypothetical protein
MFIHHNTGNMFSQMFAPDTRTNVKFLGSVFLIYTLEKTEEIIKEIWGHLACFGVTKV